MFILGYDSKEMNYATIKASLQRLTLIHKQRLHEIEKLKTEYSNVIGYLRSKVEKLEGTISIEKYYKDVYYSELIKIKKLLEERQYDQVLTIIQKITLIREDVSAFRTSAPYYRDNETSGPLYYEQEQTKLSELLSQLSVYENDMTQRNREIHDLRQ